MKKLLCISVLFLTVTSFAYGQKSKPIHYVATRYMEGKYDPLFEDYDFTTLIDVNYKVTFKTGKVHIKDPQKSVYSTYGGTTTEDTDSGKLLSWTAYDKDDKNCTVAVHFLDKSGGGIQLLINYGDYAKVYVLRNP